MPDHIAEAGSEAANKLIATEAYAFLDRYMERRAKGNKGRYRDVALAGRNVAAPGGPWI